MTAILDLYIVSGANREGVLITTPHQILSQAGLDTSGRYYQILTKSLKRLRFAAYTVTGLWYEAPQQRYTTTTFTHFSEYSFSSSTKGELTRNTEIMLRLSEHIVNSIQAKFLRHIDLNLLRALTRPLSRSLYRLLEARRMDLVILDGGEPLKIFETTLQQWASACKIVDRRSDKIRRTLEPAHFELLEHKYLNEVVFTGRGVNQNICYYFQAQENRGEVATTQLQAPVTNSRAHKSKRPAQASQKPTEDQAALILQMCTYGVSKVMATKMLSEYGQAHIIERLEKAERGLKSGYKPNNRSGFIVDIIRSESEKYISPLFEDTTHKLKKNQIEKIQTDKESEQQLESELRAIQASSRTQQLDWFFSRMRFILISIMSQTEIQIIEKQLETNNQDIIELPTIIAKLFMSGQRNKIREFFQLD